MQDEAERTSARVTHPRFRSAGKASHSASFAFACAKEASFGDLELQSQKGCQFLLHPVPSLLKLVDSLTTAYWTDEEHNYRPLPFPAFNPRHS